MRKDFLLVHNYTLNRPGFEIRTPRKWENFRSPFVNLQKGNFKLYLNKCERKGNIYLYSNSFPCCQLLVAELYLEGEKGVLDSQQSECQLKVYLIALHGNHRLAKKEKKSVFSSTYS